jgi:hypothetical protein
MFPMKKTTLTLLGAALSLAGTAHAAETAVLVDSGAGRAPVVVTTPAAVPVVPSPVLASTPDGTPVVVTPSPAPSTTVITTAPVQPAAAVIVDEGTPQIESHSVQTEPGTTLRTTTVAQPVTTTTVTADGTTVQSTAVKRTTTTQVTRKRTVTLSRSPYVYNSVYRNYARYHWNGKRWVYR